MMANKTGDVMNMKAFLGIGIQVHFKNDDWAINFKPMELITSDDRDHDTWIGTDDEGSEKTIRRNEVDRIVYR
jgi:hypothetical protein